MKFQGKIRGKIVSLFIAIALSLGLYHELRICAFPRIEDDNGFALFMFSFENHPDYAHLVPANWQSRAVSCDLSAWWAQCWGDLAKHVHTYDSTNAHQMIWDPTTQFKDGRIIASYHAFFYLLTCVALVFFVKNPVLPMFGAFASVLTCSPSFLYPYLLPWDLPTMAAWTIVCLVYRELSKRPPRLWEWLGFALMIVVLGLLKETVLVTALFFLAAPWIWPWRFLAIAAIVIASQLLNWSICHAPPDWIFAVKGINVPGQSHWNPFSLWPVLFANAGSIVLLPWLLYKKRDWPLAIVCAAFVTLNAATFLNTGYFDELRDWLELAPITWVLFTEIVIDPSIQAQPLPGDPVNSPLKRRAK
jgi:hypothetical protein